MHPARFVHEPCGEEILEEPVHDPVVEALRADPVHAAVAEQPRQAEPGLRGVEVPDQLRPAGREGLTVAPRQAGQPGVLQGEGEYADLWGLVRLR